MAQHDSIDNSFRQGVPPLPAPGLGHDLPNSAIYHGPLLTALAFTILLLLLSALILDGGEIFRLSAIALAVFWGWVFFVRWHRSLDPTKTDLLLIRWGCLPLVVGFQVAIRCVWSWRGLV